MWVGEACIHSPWVSHREAGGELVGTTVPRAAACPALLVTLSKREGTSGSAGPRSRTTPGSRDRQTATYSHHRLGHFIISPFWGEVTCVRSSPHLSGILFLQFYEKEDSLRCGDSRDRGESHLIKYPHLGGNEFLSEQMENHSLPRQGGQ